MRARTVERPRTREHGFDQRRSLEHRDRSTTERHRGEHHRRARGISVDARRGRGELQQEKVEEKNP